MYLRRIGVLRIGAPSAGAPAASSIVVDKNSITVTCNKDTGTLTVGYVIATDGGPGSLSGVQFAVSGGSWLSGTLTRSSTGWRGDLSVDTAELSLGSNAGTVTFSDGNATSEVVDITIIATALPTSTTPTIQLDATAVTLTVEEGSAVTETTRVLITSANAGTLELPTVGTITGTGAVGISTVVSSITGGYALDITATAGALTDTSSPYAATVPVISAGATNTPQNVTVTLNVLAAVAPPVTMALSNSTATLTVEEASLNVASTSVTVISGNGGTLGTTSVGTVTGTAAGVVTTAVNGHIVTVNVTAGALLNASSPFTATIPIADSVATDSPKNFTLTLNVTAQAVSRTSIPAIVGIIGASPGNVLVSIPLPLRPGDLTAAEETARKVRVFVSGVEQAIYTAPLRGAHNDDSLRAVLVQFYYNILNTTPIAAEYRLGSVRTTTDIAHVPVTDSVLWNTSVSPYQINAYMLPTDPSYLCQTQVSGMPLIPATQDDTASYKLYGAYADSRFEALKLLETTDQSAQSDYDMIRGLVGMWCRTGDIKFYTQAMSRIRYHVLYSIPSSGWSPALNLDGITVPANQQLISAEAKRIRHWNWFCGYYLTGWRQFHAMPGYGAQQAMYAGSLANVGYSRFGTNAIYWAPRNDLSAMPYMWIAMLMDSTRVVNGSGGGGFSTADYTTKMTAAWTHALANQYVENAGGTGWRTGAMFVDHRHTASGSGATGNWPFFQSGLVGRQMVDYYLMVYADSRLPPVIKEEVDRFILCAKSASGTAYAQGSNATSFTYNSVTYSLDQPRWGVPYATQPDETSGSAYTWLTPMWAVMFAFVAKYYGGNAPDGTAYSTWYQRVINVATVYHTGGGSGALGWTWKIWGEIVGANLVASWIMAQPGQPQGPATMRTPVVYTDFAPQ